MIRARFTWMAPAGVLLAVAAALAQEKSEALPPAKGAEALTSPAAPVAELAAPAPAKEPVAVAPAAFVGPPLFEDDEEFPGPIGLGPIPPLEMNWYTMDGGGTSLAEGPGFELGGTAGQPDTGLLSGGDFTLSGGFWGRVSVVPPCIGDANGDGFVSFADVSFVLLHFGTAGPAGDANVDGIVNFADITYILVNFGQKCI